MLKTVAKWSVLAEGGKRVHKFTGSVVFETGGIEKDINSRIVKASGLSFSSHLIYQVC